MIDQSRQAGDVASIMRSRSVGRRSLVVGALALLVVLGAGATVGAQTPGPCTAPVTNPIACENSKPGAPASEWDISAAGDLSIQGFATDISVNKGETVRFKIDTDATAYQLDIYRLGYYSGLGARKIATVQPSAALPQNQPACLTEPSTGLVDCGNWADSASWTVPTTATSGIYIARLVRGGTGGASHVVFVVRDDASTSPILFQTSDTTWQAYNDYGGNSLYAGSPAGRAYKVSYNRPFNTRTSKRNSWLFDAEYPMVRWLEANGYNVSYFTGVDTDRRGSRILQHRVFLSVGHDEYWSAVQRVNVEAARAAGVHLAFFSGNEVFWKTRWESSIDGANTPYRTLVVYKETHANAKIDPDPTWTGTWRDPRFSPPADGGRPENALTGTLFMVNCCRFDDITVSSEEGKFRFWRDTPLATLPAGQGATIGTGTVGYEWDEARDNGVQPAGLFRLSSTTVNLSSYLQDFGSTYGPGTATHSLTMYRHSSGALVFGAGTVRWSWGLDAEHDTDDTQPNFLPAPERDMQQATVNLLADMGVQPGTLQAGLVPATPSTDSSAPVSAITSPAANGSVQSGVAVLVTGSASDTEGHVAGVEVSVDGENTWHPATGRETWTYSWTPGPQGTVVIKSRAVDDSGNLELSGSTVSVTVIPRTCPCTFWGDGAVPAIPSDTSDTAAVELGVKFYSDVDGYISRLRFYKGSANTGTHVGNLWSANGALLATATFSGETATGWQQVTFSTPVAINANTLYVASYHAPNGGYAVNGAYFTNPISFSPLYAPANTLGNGNGVYKYGPTGFPTQTYNANNYWVDVVFSPAQPDTIGPLVVSTTPAPGATRMPLTTTVTAAFSEPVTPGSISFQLRTPTNTVVPASVTYDAFTRTATLTPSSALAESTRYTVLLQGAADQAGNVIQPLTWQFKTIGPGTSLWNTPVFPAQVDSGDANAVEVGVKFRADVNGYILGLSFYKSAANTGVHTANLWTSTGTLLSTTIFSNETASGWQDVSLPTPVPITANTTYLASYHAPNGHYSGNSGYFATSGLDNSPLHAPSSPAAGGNGVYKYGASGFPTTTYNGSNYWVDVVFSVTLPPDTVPPAVILTNPANAATKVPSSAPVTAKFSEPVTAGSVSFQLRTSTNVLVPATTSYDPATLTATLTPTASLAEGATYTATVSGAVDTAGNGMTGPATWSFSTLSCPCTLWSAATTPAVADSGDAQAVEVGVKFSSEIAGYLTGLRFYKAATNVGPHTANLWTTAGTLLATTTFTNETTSGWQQVLFPTPVAITANTTYVASYHAPNGRYAITPSQFASAGVDNYPLHAPASGPAGGNGVYKNGPSGFPTQTFNGNNYWVDVVFTKTFSDLVPPTVVAQTPASGAGRVSTLTTVRVTFSEAVTPPSLSFELRTSGNAVVPASVAYDAASRTAILTPSSPLAFSATYAATVSGARDAAGNVMTAPLSWSFSTPTCPCAVWDAATVPTQPDSGDPGAAEVGLKFRAEVGGYITGIRFYKSAANTGPHVGNLWTGTGTHLTSVPVSGESSSGWQQVNLPTPIPVTANTTYVVSYHAPVGHYASAAGAFATTGVDNAPLKALATGVDGPNGVFVYGPGGVFPIQSFNATNYWVDVVFTTSVAPDTTPPTVVAVSPTNGATGVDVATNVAVTFSESMNPATIATATIELRDAANAIVPAEVTYDIPRRIATLNPTSNLGSLAAYTVRVLGGSTDPRAKDLAGIALASTFTSAFTTVADTTPPTVSTVAPANGATGVSITASVEVRFSEDMAPTTISGTTVQLRGSAGDTVAAAVTYDAARQTAVLTPTVPLSGGATHTLTVRGGSTDPRVKDLAGIALASTFTSTFTTGGVPGAVAGQWEGPFGWPQVAVHAMLLKTGEVLIWDGPSEDLASGAAEGGGDTATLWNPATGTFTPVPNTLTDLFCTGHAALADGRILVVGGHLVGGVGLRDANIFDPVTQQWTSAPPMAYARWYPTATTLADGRVLVMSGSTTCQACLAETPEIYDPTSNTWTRLAGASAPIPLYPYNFLLPNGRIVAVGAYDAPTFVTQMLDLATQTWTVVDPRPLDGGSAAMYLPGKIMKSGTARQTAGIQANANTWVINMTEPSPTWRQTAPMSFPRVFHTLTLLPDGNVIVTGGGRNTDTLNLAGAVMEAEMWSPATESWTTMARMQTPRLYHMTALLLPDGRVLVAGSGRTEGVDQLSAEIFSPPYLFKGARPTITSAPASAQYGSRFNVATPDGASIASVSLIRAGAVTHTFHNDQRLLPLTFRQTGGGLEVDAPADANLAPPGYYMLFLVNANGVPSVAPFVAITPGTTFRDTSVADFSAGSPDANVHVGQSAPEVILRPSTVGEFAGSTLPAGWSSTAWQGGGNATVAGGMLRVDGARAGPDALRGFGSLEFVATFGSDGYQHVGLGLTFNEAPWAIFSTGGGNALYARTHNGNTATDTLIPGTWLNAPHLFRIDWTPTTVVFWIDGSPVASHTVAITANLRPLVSDFSTGLGTLIVDWLRMSPYTTSGTFLSRVFDAGGQATWGPLWWTGYAPPGTTLTLSVRTGNTPVPDGTWSPFTTVPASGSTIGGTSRYVQYRAVLTTNDVNESPALWGVAIGNGAP